MVWAGDETNGILSREKFETQILTIDQFNIQVLNFKIQVINK